MPSKIDQGQRKYFLPFGAPKFTVGEKQAVAVFSCTAALHLSLLANGVGAGDEVVTTPLTFTATANAIFMTGFSVRFADVSRPFSA